MSRPRPALVWSLLAVLVAIAAVITPYWVMRPFRPQGAGELQVALVVLRLAPWLLVGAAGVTVWMLARVWSRGWLRRIGACVAVLLVLACGAASRINLFEQMFAPMRAPSFVAVAGAPLPADEVVMAVRVGAEARGYPVRILAYHHIVNDELGEVPLVATY
jgi:hypothetical protein